MLEHYLELSHDLVTFNTLKILSADLYFNVIAKRADLVYGSDYSTTVDGMNVTLTLTGGVGEDIQLYVQKITVDAWIDII